MALEQIDQDFIRVTEQAAIACGKTMGYGDREHADQVAVEAMRHEMDQLPINGRIVIGEGERDKAPMLYVGEEVGSLKGHEDDGVPKIDIAVDPLEGTNLCATGAPGAVAVLAAAERGGLLHAPDIYMEKIVVGPTARGVVHLDAPVAENLRNIAKAFRREIRELTIVVLERERHAQLIADIRSAGARIRLIGDGDLSAGISAAVRGTGVHAVIGTGGAPEGVITAAAMRCLGGEIQARLTALNDEQKQRLKDLKINDPDRIYSTRDLAPGNNIVFSCTGVTDGELLRGTRFFGGGGTRTSTLFMSLTNRIIRFVDTIHREDMTVPVHFQ
jgi:fructose-1,6-bisphosphatase class II